MKLTLLPSSLAGPNAQYLTTFVVNGSVAIDAGCLGWSLPVPDQARVTDVFLTHSHIDHVAALPQFLENVIGLMERCPRVHGTAAVLRSLREHLFNDILYPDFIRLSESETRLIELVELYPGRCVSAAGLRLLPVAVNHPVPTVGYVIDDDTATVAVITDTGATQAIWDVLNRDSPLRGVFLDVSFPDSLAGLAARSGHLTPDGFATEVTKLRPGVPVYAVHLKARFAGEIETALARLNLPNVEIVVPGREYIF